MIGWLLASAFADPATDRLRQREAVEQAAAAVALARADGERRNVVELMAVYRAAAAELERMEAGLLPTLEEERRQRVAAVAELTSALAEGLRESPARIVITTWLGDPTVRLGVLEAALPGTLLAPPEIRDGVLSDVVEQAHALVVLLAFDARTAERVADQLTLRAVGLSRAAPGQALPIGAEVEAMRLEQEAQVAEQQEEMLEALGARAAAVRAGAVRALEGGP